MKAKVMLMTIAALLVGAMAFAAGPDSYKVKAVTGKVTYEAAPGTWKNVTVGQELSVSTVVNTSLNSSLVVVNGKSNVTIKAMQKGTIESLTGVAAAGGIKKSGTAKTAVAAEVDGTSKGVATASSRASEAKSDLDWDEEE